MRQTKQTYLRDQFKREFIVLAKETSTIVPALVMQLIKFEDIAERRSNNSHDWIPGSHRMETNLLLRLQ